MTVVGNGQTLTVTVEADAPVLFVWLETGDNGDAGGKDAVFSDNFFHLAPGEDSYGDGARWQGDRGDPRRLAGPVAGGDVLRQD